MYITAIHTSACELIKIAVWLCLTAHAIFPPNFGTIKLILPGFSSTSHHEGPGTEVDVSLLLTEFPVA